MYVIRVRYGENPWKFFVAVENQILVVSSIRSKSMVFFSRADALLMVAFIENYFERLNPDLVLDYIRSEDEDDFCISLNEEYFEL